jgi:hypothetical protein
MRAWQQGRGPIGWHLGFLAIGVVLIVVGFGLARSGAPRA